jgi:plastocyanin
MKRLLISVSLVALVVGAGVPALAATQAKSGSIVIRHQLRACHTWSLNGGPYKPSLDVRLAPGRSLTITNADPMVHKLIQEDGRRVAMRTISHDHMNVVGLHKITGSGVMNHMGAAVKVTFPRAGVYRFTTKDLGDYFELKAIGDHNHLMLVVRVS